MVTRGHSIQWCCRILDVPESSFYSERRRVPSARSVRHAWLTDVIGQVHSDARGVYGAMRVHAELTKGLWIKVSHGTVALVMQPANIQGITGRRKRHYVPPLTTQKDLVDRQFSRDLPNQLWVTDITEHPTWVQGVLASAPLTMDFFPRWEPLVIVSITPLSSHFGVVSKSNFWIVSPGRLDFNSQQPCPITS